MEYIVTVRVPGGDGHPALAEVAVDAFDFRVTDAGILHFENHRDRTVAAFADWLYVVEAASEAGGDTEAEA